MWTEAQFLKAIREGKYKGLDNTRPLLPPMPWQEYRNASDEDLKAVFRLSEIFKTYKERCTNSEDQYAAEIVRRVNCEWSMVNRLAKVGHYFRWPHYDFGGVKKEV